LPSKVELIDDDGCFACGRANPMGLKLEFVFEGDEYVTYFTPAKQHQGWLGITHGGIVSTVLDEVMARAMHLRQISALTAEMTVRFKRPAVVGTRIRFAGRIDSEEGRLILCSATAHDESGTLIAEATERLVKV
jgi:acyl-coenzyme A thioesterase PaaI-like protein